MAEQPSFLAAFLSYANVKTPVNVRSMGLLDSKMPPAGGAKMSNSSPTSGEIKSKSKRDTDLPPEKLAALNKFINSPEKKQKVGRDWLVDFTVENEKKRSPCSKAIRDFKEKQCEDNTIKYKLPANVKTPQATISDKSKTSNNLKNLTPKVKCERSQKGLDSSPSQNLRHRKHSDEKPQNELKSDKPQRKSKSRLARGIKFEKNENSETKRILRVRKRKLEEEPVESDTDSEITFKPQAKRRKICLSDTYKMAPLRCDSPLQTRGRRLANAVRGLHKTITEKRELKKLEKEIKHTETGTDDVRKTNKADCRLMRKRKFGMVRSSARIKNNANESSSVETNDTVLKKSRLNLVSPKKKCESVIEKQKLGEENKILVNECDKEPKDQSHVSSPVVSNSDSPLKNQHILGPAIQRDQSSPSFSLSPKLSPAKKFDMYSSPLKLVSAKSPVKVENTAETTLEDSSDKPLSSLTSPLSAGINAQTPQFNRLTASPKVKGLPAVLSLNTLSGIPQQIQGSSFSSVHQGFGTTVSSVLPNRMDSQFATFRKGNNKHQKFELQRKTFTASANVRKFASAIKVCSKLKRGIDKKRTYTCDVCGKVLTHPGSMQRHRRDIHGIRKNKSRKHKFIPAKLKKDNLPVDKNEDTSMSNNDFSSQVGSNESQKTDTEVEPCEFCGKVYNKKNSLIRHRIIQHNAFFSGRKPRKAVPLKRSKSMRKLFECNTCNMKFSSYSSFWIHRKIHASVTQKSRPAETLDKTGSLTKNQKTHESKNDKVDLKKKKTFKCLTCGRILGNAGSLVTHQKIHADPYRANKCYTCGELFRNADALMIHRKKVHAGGKPYKCDRCDRSFNSYSWLRRHQREPHSDLDSPSVPAPTKSSSVAGISHTSSRPKTLSIDVKMEASTAQGINNPSSQSALNTSIPKISVNTSEDDDSSRLAKIKTKRTLAETVDMLRHSSNLNGLSVLKNNSLSKKNLTPSDDGSRNSSRCSSGPNSPNVTPIKSEVLTPSSTPCSTPKKSSVGSRSPSLDRSQGINLKWDQKFLFRKGDTVLAQWHDGLYYLGKILKIDEKSTRCMLQYEDNSKYWSLFKDIHRGAKDGEMICCVCMGDNSEKPNEIVLCDNCGQGYHQNCHTPVVGGSEILDPNAEWCCRKCIFALTMKAGGALKEGKYGEELRKMKITFPYDIKSLSWDAQHKTNSEQYYCYCGGPGVWYQKMLQCCRCKQWFHETCIQCLKFPLLYADSFYIFVCTACNFGQEYIKRIHIDWPDLVHIAMFNMVMENNLKYYEFEDLMYWINENWHLLQVDEYDDLDLEERQHNVQEALIKNTSRFKNGNEIRKRYTLWGLRARVPPPRTHVTLPINGLVTDEVMKDLKVKGRRSKVFMPIACKTPVTMRHSPLQLRAAAKRRMLQNSPLLLDEVQQVGQFLPEIASETAVKKSPKKKSPKGPLLERLIPPLPSYEGHNHPFKHAFEQQQEKVETEQRTAIWNYCLSKDSTEDDSFSASPEGPPVLVKEEPVDLADISGDMSPPLSEASETSRHRGRRRRSETPKLISAPGVKRSQRLSLRKQVGNTPPQLEETASLKPQISVQKVRSAKANYLCAFDKFGYGKGMYVLGKRENDDGTLDYLISW